MLSYTPVLDDDGEQTGYHRNSETGEVVTLQDGWDDVEDKMDDLSAQLATVTAERDAALEALSLLVRDLSEYGAWHRPCHALDAAIAVLKKKGVPNE